MKSIHKLAPFNKKLSCSKCGSTEVKRKYQLPGYFSWCGLSLSQEEAFKIGEKNGVHYEKERIKIFCGCGFCWYMKTKS